jgi:DNA integrity scanning protein DisA with diadenylate cyclase activity
MSDFNKEQLQIFLHNLFTVTGLLFSYHTLTEGYKYYENEMYTRMSIEFFFGAIVGTISLMLLFSAIKKGVDEFIQIYMPNGFSGIIENLEKALEEKNEEIEQRKKEINSDNENNE